MGRHEQEEKHQASSGLLVRLHLLVRILLELALWQENNPSWT